MCAQKGKSFVDAKQENIFVLAEKEETADEHEAYTKRTEGEDEEEDTYEETEGEEHAYNNIKHKEQEQERG